MHKLVFFDTETTDINPPHIIQIALNWSDHQYETLCRPPVPISIGAMATHHIREDMVADEDPFFISAQGVVQELIDEGCILVAHNIEFDLSALELGGVRIPDDQLLIDTLAIASKLHPDSESHSLQYLRYALRLDNHYAIGGNAHSAQCDVDVLKALFESMILIYQQQGYGRNEAIEAMIAITKESMKPENFVLHFGKHKGKTLGELVNCDYSYLQWMAGNINDPRIVEKIKALFAEREAINA